MHVAVAPPPDVGRERQNPPPPPVCPTSSGLAPPLFIPSPRDMLLGGPTILDRHFLNAGDQTQLIVFEGLPHAFWNNASLPESKEADHDMASFFRKYLYGSAR